MPYVYLYECDRCQFDVEIVICREFRKDPQGTPVDYEYPASEYVEWPPKRVSGLWSRLWCPQCHTVRPHVVVELDEPAEHPVQAFLAAEARGFTGMETVPCPECGTTLELEPENERCPHCGEGTLVCLGEYEP